METVGRGEPKLAPPSVVARGSSIFVGRDDELQVLRSALRDALSDQGRLVLLAGEPGIGKSRLADEIAEEARGKGATVLWGRCWEAGGAPAYWPWLQSLRPLVRALPPEQLRTDLGEGASDLAEVLPELGRVLAKRRPTEAADPQSARFRLFDAVASLLRSAARTKPLVLVLDDVHVADTPSLLLEFVAGELRDARMLVLAAYRDTELGEGHPLTETLTRLLGHPVTRLSLGGMNHR
jgi:predicted ATPase